MRSPPDPTFLAPMSPAPGLEPYARQAVVAGTSLFYFDSGIDFASPPYLLVHGLGDEADTWREVFLALAARRRVIAPDLPGFGRSHLPEQPLSVSVYVNTLLGLLDHLKLPPAMLVGHSLGAALAQHVALQHPARAASLVLISGGLATGKAPLSFALLLFLIPGMGEWSYRRLRKDPRAAYQTLYPYYANLDQRAQAERDFLFQRVNQRVWSDKQRTAFLGILRSLARWLPAQQKTLAQRLVGSPVQTRIVWGAEDRVAPPQTASLLASLYPPERPALLTLIHGGGHNVHQEFPEKLVELIQ